MARAECCWQKAVEAKEDGSAFKVLLLIYLYYMVLLGPSTASLPIPSFEETIHEPAFPVSLLFALKMEQAEMQPWSREARELWIFSSTLEI